MKISVVVPVFNDVLHIRDCLESIIKQNYFDTEILVFDAGSTDGTLAILKEYKRFFAFFRSQPDHGQVEVLNLAAKKYATGDRSLLKILMYWKFHTLPQCSVFMRTSIFEEIGYLNPMYDLAFDYDFWLRCAQRTKTIQYFDHDFSYYRLHPNAKTVKYHAKALSSLESISRKFLKDLPIHKRVIYSLSEKFSDSKYLSKNA